MIFLHVYDATQYERLYDTAEAWLAMPAGASLRALALQAALREGHRQARIGLLEVAEKMLRSASLPPDITAARLLLDPATYGSFAIEVDEGMRVLFSAGAHGGSDGVEHGGALSRPQQQVRMRDQR